MRRRCPTCPGDQRSCHALTLCRRRFTPQMNAATQMPSVGAGLQESGGFSGDRQLLVRGYHSDCDRCTVGRDHPRDFRPYVVQLRIHSETEVAETVDHRSPECRVVLSDTGREAEHIEPTENCQVRAQVVLEPMDVHIERQLR